MSKDEEHITKILLREHIKFEREKAFSDLKKGRFRFDFYLPGRNIIIECDGAQHFSQVKHFQKTRRDFLKQLEHDRRKNSYCLANGITLFRIPYWEIENIKKYSDIFQPKFLVKNKWHNDYLHPPK